MLADTNKNFKPLPLEDWEDTLTTVHLWLQIVGKVKLDLMPQRNHWWNITFHVDTTGLTSGPIPHDNGSFELNFDFLKHEFRAISSWGVNRSFPLQNGLSVSDFYKKFFDILKSMKVTTSISPNPYDHPCEEPFKDCITINSYDKEYVQRFWKILVEVDKVFKEFSGRFYGKVSPSHIYWHHFDLAVTRYSGNTGPELWEGATIADMEAYSHEVISAGFWAGDKNVRGAAFYSYTYPSPEGIDQEPLQPAAAKWVDSNGSPMATLMYDDILQSENPTKDIMDFLESSYRAGAKRANWDPKLDTGKAVEQ